MNMRSMLCLLTPVICLMPATYAQTAPSVDGAPKHTRLPKPSASITMEFWGPRPVVQARVNGRGPYRFILDTGTSFAVVIDKSIIEQLKLPAAPLLDAASIEPLLIDSITVGDAEFADVLAVPTDFGGGLGSDGRKLAGILGMALFKNCLLTLDFPARKVLLESGRLNADDANSMPLKEYDISGGILMVAHTVAGQMINSHIDTGSPSVLTLLNKWRDKLPLIGEPRMVGRAYTPSGTVDLRQAVLNGVLKIGKHEFQNPKVNFADLGPMVTADCGNIGSGLLKDFTLIVDQKNRCVRLHRGSADANASASPEPQKSDKPCRIGVAFHIEGDRWMVDDVIPGDPGDKAGLRTGDIILSLNGESTGEIKRADVGAAFRSPKPVKLKIQRDEKTMTLTLTPTPAD